MAPPAPLLIVLLAHLLTKSATAASPPTIHPLQCSWSPHPFPIPGSCPPPIDALTHPPGASFAPWSFPPACLNRVDAPSAGPQYCIYTDRAFRGGRGLSVLTTPSIAASVVPLLDDGLVSARLHAHPSMSTSTGQAAAAGPPPAYQVQKLPGRGRGTVATRRIRAWETVLVDYPAMLTRNEFSAVSRPAGIRVLLERGVDQLPEAQRTRVLALAHSGKGELIRDILKTNVFGGIGLGGEPHIGLFPFGSRVNHNCRPNTFWRFDPETLAQEVVAMRDIQPGEEISHSYTPLGHTFADRQQQLRGWGFNCTCALCSAPAAAVAASDRRRVRLQEIYEEFDSYSMEERYMDERVEELSYLIEVEEIWPLFCEYYMVVARAYIAFGNLQKARRYAQIADDTWHRYGGEHHDNVEGMKELWKDIDDPAASGQSGRRR